MSDYKVRLKNNYKSEVVKKLQDDFGFKNTHQIPKLEKITVNCVTREAAANAKVVDMIKDDLRRITGQEPITVRAKASIASFKLREGQAMGAAVTIRGNQMYEFLDRLVSLTLPRVKDFQGISPKGFDGKGNYTLGIKEQIVFPEIDYDKIDKIRGLGICFVTSAKTNDEGLKLLKHLGMPFREKH